MLHYIVMFFLPIFTKLYKNLEDELYFNQLNIINKVQNLQVFQPTQKKTNRYFILQ
jgi:hypothetical protein